MAVASQQEMEHAAYQALLESGFLQRAPSLRRILVYICTQHFAGKADEIKEYNIAVEALGKPPQFDQKSSSVVRVEMHRLRRRLQQYYATEGAAAPVEISVPEGSYAPVFRARGAEPAEPGDAAEPPVESRDAARTRGKWFALAAVGAAGLVLLVVAMAWKSGGSRTGRAAASTMTEAPRVAQAAPDATVRILAGRPPGAYVDRFGRTWRGDEYYTGGSAITTPYAPIARATDPILYKTMREGNAFRYDIPLPRGTYEMRLYFAETIFGPGNPGSGGETYRIFQVLANGRPILRDFDVIADAPGANVEDVRVFTGVGPGEDGKLHLELATSGSRSAFLNAIEIQPGGRAMQPLRFVAGEATYVDPSGAAWHPDWIAAGGILAARPWAQRGDPRNGVHRSERFGNFSYSIPVAPGRYTLLLHFAEAWFGPDLPGQGGEGRRVFDVYCGGQTLLKNFDIFRQAGGSMKPVVREFRGIRPNAQGKIVLSFVPVVNYAAINAVEVIAEEGE